MGVCASIGAEKESFTRNENRLQGGAPWLKRPPENDDTGRRVSESTGMGELPCFPPKGLRGVTLYL